MTPGTVDFRGPIVFRGPLEGPSTSWNDTDKSVCGPWKIFFFFFFGDHIKIWRKLRHFALKNFFFSFLRSHQNAEKIVSFSSFILEHTKLVMPNILADPGPTFGSRHPCSWLRGASWLNEITFAFTLLRMHSIAMSTGLHRPWYTKMIFNLGPKFFFFQKKKLM